MSGRITNVKPKPGYLMDGATGDIIPARRNVLPMPLARDGLANVMSGRGTTVDARSYNEWFLNLMLPQQAEAAYRGNWLARKIVDIPAKDMTREGRTWQAKKDDIEKLEAEEKRLKLWPKLLRCLVLARLFGGAALIPSVGDTDLSQPLDLDSIKSGGVRFVNVLNRWQMSHGNEVLDPESEWFGMPEWFQIQTKAGAQIMLHPSRVFAFVGQKVPEGTQFTQSDSWFWGDPILQSINDAVQDATAAQSGFAALIDEAAVDVINIPGLSELVGDEESEARLMNRLSLAKRGQSNYRAKILDEGETWNTREISWGGIPQVMRAFLELVAGAADIPLTRLLGISASGLGSNGDGEERDYHSKVMADQGELLQPQLERIDELLIRSALGSRPSDIYFEFKSLERPDEAKDAEIDSKVADTIKKYGDTGLFDDEALAEIAKNRMIESGRWPGCEAAFEAHPDVPEDDPDPDAGKTAAQLAAEKVEAMRVAGAVTDDQAALLMDAKPRSLYVQRKLVNAAEFLAWAKGQGFADTLTADELHVTIAYSRTPVDWLKVDAEDWNQESNGQITVPPGGPRIVEPLGDKGAVVLLFGSSRLSWRHEQIIRAGASHDFDDYQPHVTITYAVPDGLDLAKVEPYRGKLVFGPEIFEEVNEDWAPKMGKGAGEGAARPFADYDPNQPRDPGGEGGGQWVAAGGSGKGVERLTPETKAQLIAANEGKSIDEIRADAEKNQAALHTIGTAVQADLGIEFAPPPQGFEVKTRDSIERKIRDEGYSGAHELTDISRASFIATEPAHADQVIAALAKRGTVFDKGWQKIESTGYIDRKVYLQHPNGGVSEVQIVPKTVQQLKLGRGHELYEIYRLPSRPLKEREEAAKLSRDLYAAAIRGTGFEKVGAKR